MKKLLLVALVAAGMTACMQNEELALPKSEAIAFDNAYVYNPARAGVTTTTQSIANFDVWAFMDEVGGTVLTDEDVTRGTSGWTYRNTQYWMPNHTYYFAALSPANTNNITSKTLATGEDAKLGLGKIAYTNVAGTEDLLYAVEKTTTPDYATLTNNGMPAVALEFKHLLSKVKFSFKNGYTTDNVTVKVSNVTMKVANNATIDLAQASYNWENLAGETVLNFGSVPATLEVGQPAEATANERLTIPADANTVYTVNFHVDVYVGTLANAALSLDKEATVTGYALEMGKAYNFVAEITPANLGLSPIEFTAEVDEWQEPVVDVPVGYYVTDNGTYVATTVNGLAQIAEEINAGVETGRNIVLDGDLDLNAVRSLTSNWTPIGTEENPFVGTFDGNDKTVKNLTLVETEAKEGKVHTGFFGYAKDATIKNVVFENVTINIPCLDIDHSQGHIGAVVGTLEGTSLVEDVTVKGDIKIETTLEANGSSRVAVVVGGNTYANVTMKNVHVVASEVSYLKANNNVGALAGQLQNVAVYENCSSNINVTGYKFFAGGLVGLTAGTSTFTNCHSTGDVTILAGREGRHNDEYRVGGIAGGWADGKTKVCTLEGCSYTGTVSGKNVDGTVANPLDYAGYVGRGYTLANCAGSKVVIDGTEYVQKYDNVYGVYTINGCTPVSTADELKAALAEGEGVVLAGSLNNVAVDTKAPYGNYYGVAQNGGVFDGGNNVLDFDMGTRNSDGKYDNYGIMTSGGTIQNVTITGVFRGIVIMNPAQDLYVDNVTIGDDDVCYAINTAEGNGQHSVYVSNSTIKGWSSFGTAVKDLTFTNCTFAQGTYYNNVYGRLVKPYVTALFDGCEFCNKAYLDLSALQADQVVTLKNCTVNGVKLTAENWTSLIAPEATCGNGQISVELKDGSYLTATNVVDYVVFE